MRKYLILPIVCCLSHIISQAQNTDLGLSHGRFYAIFKSKDDGKGFINPTKSQFNPYPTININSRISSKFSTEVNISFLAYDQYISTRLHPPNFYSDFFSGNFSLTANYSVINKKKFDTRVKLGVGLGIVPDIYQADFTEILVYPIVDSIARGTIKRDFTLAFPTLCTGIDFSYLVSKRFKATLRINYQQGFFKITEYDIYYNDGNGSNDQHARQWGNGTFYGAQVGVRYILNNKTNKK